MSNEFYRFIEHTFTTRRFHVFHILTTVEEKFPPKVTIPVLL